MPVSNDSDSIKKLLIISCRTSGAWNLHTISRDDSKTPITRRRRAVNTLDIDHFRSILEQQLEELLQQAKGTVTDISHQASIHADPVDRAAYDEERNRLLRFRDRESALINKIGLALERIEDGTYGVCEECGDEISIKRLSVRPVTTKCITCKTREEKFERLAG
jgi:RNA polymerase-binding transcription factor